MNVQSTWIARLSSWNRLFSASALRPALGFVAGFSVSTAGCAISAAPACRSDSECASGTCLPSGACAAMAADASARFGQDGGQLVGGDGTSAGDSSIETSSSDTGKAADSASIDLQANEVAKDAPATPADAVETQAIDSQTSDAAPTLCVPNHDGVVAWSELPLAAGLSVPYHVAHNVTVDLVPKTVDGIPTWDFTTLTNDKVIQLTTLDPKTLWFSKYYPTATYAVQVTESSPLLGIFRLTDKALELLAVASPVDSLFATRITYDPPAVMLQLPLTGTAKWTTKSSVSGQLDGVIALWSETTELTVIGAGQVVTPLGAFPVLAIQGRVDKQIGLMITTYRSYAFVTECYGVVAKVDSKANETQPVFSQAAEARRIGP
ncbi:MAG: hypothetical protein EXR77_09580 [Myxococcales bacterium]|nr:hypothetical protein [Myxococcales bacterium]